MLGPCPAVMAPRPRGEGLPGLTRSCYEREHALITPESRVWCGPVDYALCLPTSHISFYISCTLVSRSVSLSCVELSLECRPVTMTMTMTLMVYRCTRGAAQGLTMTVCS